MMQLMSPRLALALLLALPTLSACAGQARTLEPLVVGREQLFKVEWEVAHRSGRPVVSGSLSNDAPYAVKGVQLLVEALDANRAVVTQEVTEVASHLGPSMRTYFELPAQASPSTTYRVRVSAFDPVDGCGD